jgi:predicted GH43/DUF377 family glycosyl hydrolase
MIRRYIKNPILKPSDIIIENDELDVFGVFNPGATRFNNKIILLLRVALKCKEEKNWIKVLLCDRTSDYNLKIVRWRKRKSLSVYNSDPRFIIINEKKFLTSLSLFYLAQSDDGINFSVTKSPVMSPANEYETFGIEDPRIIKIDDTYYITYTSVSENSFCAALAKTNDFKNFRRVGIIFPPENKDVVLFPKKIGNKYYCLHRPTVAFIGRPSVWISRSDDLINWGNHNLLFAPLNNKWERKKIGAGPEPILTNRGWLVLYHSVSDDEVYTLSSILLDEKNPRKIIGRTLKPILSPEYWYEKEGVIPDVVFSNGWVRMDEDKLLIYYGSADKYVSVAECKISSLINYIK